MNEFKPDIVIFHYPNPFVAAFLKNYYVEEEITLAVTSTIQEILK